MTIAVGDKLPDVKLVVPGESGPEAVQSADYFKGKRVALFSVPGAFFAGQSVSLRAGRACIRPSSP